MCSRVRRQLCELKSTKGYRLSVCTHYVPISRFILFHTKCSDERFKHQISKFSTVVRVYLYQVQCVD